MSRTRKNNIRKNKSGPAKHKQQKGSKFWESEYSSAQHLAMSLAPAEDLEKFTRWLEREMGPNSPLQSTNRLMDMGCGNGRNSYYLVEHYGMNGWGFDISHEAIKIAKSVVGDDAGFEYMVHSLGDMPYPVEQDSCDLVIDMMASHVLNFDQRQQMHQEVARVLRTDGWYFLKTFLLDEDINAKQMIRDYPGDEPNSYIHPKMKHTEYVLSEDQIIEELERDGFYVHKVLKSYKHIIKGRAAKRRSICVYAQKNI